MDMIRAQSTDASNPAGAAGGASSMGMVSATASKAASQQVPTAVLSGIDALERSAEQEAWQRSAASGAEKRKFAASDEDGEDEPPRKGVRDSDEIDI